MTKKFLLLFIFATFLVSSVTFFCILWYLDPFQNPVLSYTTLGVTILLVSTSFLTMILYIFKNVYYRGAVNLSHIFASLRQSFLLTLALLGAGVLVVVQLFSWVIFGIFLVFLLCVEGLVRNV